MADPQFPNRPARVTPNLGIPVPGDQDLADYVTDWGAVADATDAAVTEAAQGISDQVAAAGAGSLPYTFLTMGA
jgi:hypothetical protein